MDNEVALYTDLVRLLRDKGKLTSSTPLPDLVAVRVKVTVQILATFLRNSSVGFMVGLSPSLRRLVSFSISLVMFILASSLSSFSGVLDIDRTRVGIGFGW